MAQGTRHGFARYWLPVLAYVVLIFSLSSIPRLTPPFQFINSDKVIHMAEYSVLGFLLTRALRTIHPLRTLLAAGLVAIGIGMTIGGLDEYYQKGVPGRESSPLDWVADTLGLSIAAIGYAWSRRPRGMAPTARRAER